MKSQPQFDVTIKSLVHTDEAWRHCGCAVCAEAGIHVLVFRGLECNKRRGFHNLAVFYQQFRTALKLPLTAEGLVCHSKQPVGMAGLPIAG